MDCELQPLAKGTCHNCGTSFSSDRSAKFHWCPNCGADTKMVQLFPDNIGGCSEHGQESDLRFSRTANAYVCLRCAEDGKFINKIKYEVLKTDG